MNQDLIKQTGVYLIRNLVNGKLYVGSASKSFKLRWQNHLKLLQNGNHQSEKLQSDYDIYGKDSFEFEIALTCGPKNCLFYEQQLIDQLDVVNKGYNVSPHAGAPMRGRKHSKETRNKMKRASLGKKKSAEHAKHIGDSERGVPLPGNSDRVKLAWKTRRLTLVSEETRRKLSEAGMGRPVSEKSRQALIARNKARKGIKTGPMSLTEEEHQRRIDANKARVGKIYEGEQKEYLKAKKRAAWAERKAKGLHTRRWYTNRGLEVPVELPTELSN
jgi:group I intron endonuclease